MTGKPMTKVEIDPDMKEVKSERRMLGNENIFEYCRGESRNRGLTINLL